MSNEKLNSSKKDFVLQNFQVSTPSYNPERVNAVKTDFDRDVAINLINQLNRIGNSLRLANNYRFTATKPVTKLTPDVYEVQMNKLAECLDAIKAIL